VVRPPKVAKGAPRPRRAVVEMAPYVPPTSGRAGKLRLDFNENTAGCSPRVIEFLRSQLSPEQVAVYPEYTQARTALAAHFRVPPPQLLLTNGTDEAIQVLVNTYVDDGDEVVLLRPSYAMYRFYAQVAGASIREIPYRPEELLKAITPATRVVLIANPNNPTGTGVNLQGIERILKRARRAAVLVDEAYYEFSGISALGLLDAHPNLFVSRTFSKIYGLAGMRLGCLFSHPANVAYLHKAQSPYSVNVVAALAACEAVRDSGFVAEYVAEVLAARELLCVEFEKMGIPYFQSQANFVLFRVGRRAVEIRDRLRERGVLVRDRSYEVAGSVRVTVGTREQTRRFLEVLKEIW